MVSVEFTHTHTYGVGGVHTHTHIQTPTHVVETRASGEWYKLRGLNPRTTVNDADPNNIDVALLEQ